MFLHLLSAHFLNHDLKISLQSGPLISEESEPLISLKMSQKLKKEE